MAMIYPQTYGQRLSEVEPVAELPYPILCDLFDFNQAIRSNKPPVFRDSERQSVLAEAGYARKKFWIVIELTEAEAGSDERYCMLPISPEEARSRIARVKIREA